MSPNFKSNLKKSLTKRPAVSLVIALVMVLAFMNLSADIMQSMSRTQNIAKGGMSADQAQLNAQLGLELGLYSQNKPKEFKTLINAIAANSNYKHDSKDGNNTLTDKDGNVVASWQISDSLETKPVCVQTETNGLNCSGGEFFVYPYPGSGTVGGQHCNIKTQPIQKNNQWLEDMYFIMKGKKYEDLVNPIDKSKFALEEVGEFDTLDHPCLWNTVVKGSSAEVPLFRIDSDGKEIGAENIDEFYVRAHLPCKNGSACLEKDRWQVATKNGGNSIADTRALIWNIVTDCKKDTLCYLSEASAKELNDNLNDKGKAYSSFYFPSQITYERLKNGLNIFKKTILAYEDDKLLAGVDGTKNQNIGPIQDFLNNKKPWNDFQNSKPFFHLSIASPLYVNPTSDQTVDTVEYQILYTQKKTIPPVITNPTVRAQGSNGGYTVNVESSLSKQTGAFNFSLIGN